MTKQGKDGFLLKILYGIFGVFAVIYIFFTMCDAFLGDGEPYLHNSIDNEFDGEPDMPIQGEFKIIKGET